MLFRSLICVILGVQSIYSQKADSLRSLYLSKSLAKDINLSLYSPTFSSSSFDKQIAYSDVGITFRNEIGNFHRVQLAENYNSVGFMADGSYIGKRLYMVGTFDFQQEFKNKVSFTSLLNPFRGTPYDLADSTSSNWRVQNYCVNGKIAYELVPGALSLGLDGSINVARGAKQIDPRPKTNNNDIVFTPSLSFHRNGHIISIGGSYKMFKENVNLILYNSSESQKIYQLKGLGQIGRAHV